MTKCLNGLDRFRWLWYGHVHQFTDLRARLPAGTRARLAGLLALVSAAEALAGRLHTAGLPASVLRRAVPVVRRQAYVQVPPAELFGIEAIARSGRFDTLLFLAGHDRDAVTVDRVDAADVGHRMHASLEEERGPFMAHYRQFRFAFPDLRSETVERAAEIERSLLDQLFADRAAHVVRHPYPVRLDSLFGPIEAVLPVPPSP